MAMMMNLKMISERAINGALSKYITKMAQKIKITSVEATEDFSTLSIEGCISIFWISFTGSIFSIKKGIYHHNK
jgi:hypothetical protein